MKTLLVSTAVAILILGAPAALAQPDNRGGGKHQDRSPDSRQEQAGPDRGQAEHGRHGGAQVQTAPAPAQAQPPAPVQAQARPEREQRQPRQEAQAPNPMQAPVQAQAQPEREQRQLRQQAQAPNQMQAPVQAQARPEREQRQLRQQVQAPNLMPAPVQTQARPERQQAPDRRQWRDNPVTFRTQVQPQVQPQIQRPASQVQASRSNQAIPPRHVQQRNQWQGSNQDWNRSTVWQRDRNWWRGNDAFRNYSGVRLNFFFAPGYGYYNVPRQYRQRSWHEGDYLPRYFMRYVVNDYRSYGLPRPPYNCRWIWVNNSILLVDRSDRYILDEVSDIW